MTKDLIIDGIRVEPDPSKTVLEVAQEMGIHIPTLCYHKALTPYGACRICVVETIWKGRSKLQTACTFPAWEGEVRTNSEKVRKARRLILELMLAEAPESEEIQKLADEYGAERRKYKAHRAGPENKCIMCGLCVRTCTDIMKVGAIGFKGRGYKREIVTPFDEYSDVCSTCGACAYVCPTNAIKLEDITDKKITPILSEFEAGLEGRPAVYFPSTIAVPNKPVIDRVNCMFFKNEACEICSKVCEPNAINYNQKEKEEEIEVDTIIVATGYDIFDAAEKKVYGYGKYQNVITALQMERMIVHAAEGKPIRDLGKRIAFIQCVGSRDEQVGNEYCSRICCMYATKLSQLLKRSDPKKDVYIFYTDLRSYGKGFEEYYKRAQREGVKFIRGRTAEIIENSRTKKLTLKVEDTLSRQIIESEFDTVVLSVGMRPNEGTNKIAELLKLAKSPDGFLKEAHPKFRPVDTLSEGIFICGTAQGPKDIPDSVAQGSAAASRAIRLMNPGKYEAEPFIASVNEDVCSGCGVCLSICPYGALEIVKKDGKRISQVNEVLCKCCGGCVCACPSAAMEQKGFTSRQILSMVKAAF